jgi:tRNA pseudouridine55 synthase
VGKPRGGRVDGVLLLDKPGGMTSNLALQKARRLLNAAKAGHTGTLDPMATGLLPVTFGEATKFSADLLDADKAYRATLRLGMTTTTGDAEGDVTRTVAVDATDDSIDAAVSRNGMGARCMNWRGPVSRSNARRGSCGSIACGGWNVRVTR